MNEYILKNIFSIFGKENVKAVIYYGNKQGEDIDVFVIVVGETEYNCTQKDRFDITYIGDKLLKKMIKNLDPLLTEPILTGDVIYGRAGYVKNDLNNVNPSEKVVNYLINKALLYLDWANAHFQNGDLVDACGCVRFSLGFCCFAIHYNSGGRITVFSTVLNEAGDKRAIIEKASKMAKNDEKTTNESVKNILTEAYNVLTKSQNWLLCK